MKEYEYFEDICRIWLGAESASSDNGIRVRRIDSNPRESDTCSDDRTRPYRTSADGYGEDGGFRYPVDLED